MYTHSKENLNDLSPEQAYSFLKEGNDRFIKNLSMNRNLLQQVNDTAGGQFPFAAVLSCMDSRTSAELIFDQGLGDIFSIRIAGNILNDDILGSLEYAACKVGVKVIVVLGHTNCGAVTGACNDVKSGYITGLLEKIRPAIDAETETSTERHGGNAQFVQNVADINVRQVMSKIPEQSSDIAGLIANGQLKIGGGMYDVVTGKVTFYE